MKRQIFTALSVTLLISSPLTLNAGKTKKKKPEVFSLAKLSTDIDLASASSISNTSSTSSSTTNLPSLALTTSAQASSSSASSTQPDEFDPRNTAPQRAALFAAIVAIEHKKNKGLKEAHCFHELERQDVMQKLYKSEDHNIIPQKEVALDLFPQNFATERDELLAKKALLLFRLNAVNASLKNLKQEKTDNEATPTKQDVMTSLKEAEPFLAATQQLHDEDFDKLSESSNSDNNNNNIVYNNNNNNNNNNCNPSTSTSTSTPAPAAGGWSTWGWGLLGYNK